MPEKLDRLVCSIVLFALLSVVPGCGKKSGLDYQVVARTPDELAATREHLENVLDPQHLQFFDTAVQELKLDAMNAGIEGAARRDEEMRTRVEGKSVRDVILLGWKARQGRLTRELKDMTERLNRDLPNAERPGGKEPGTFLANRIQNEKELVAQLTARLEETNRQLTEWERERGQ